MPSALIALFVTTLVVVSTRAEPPLNIGLGDLGINNDGGYSSSSLDSSYGVPNSGGYSDGGSLSSGGYSDSSSLGGYEDSHGSKGEIIATSAGKGVRYAGPIVYTNEKPPVIHFPRPPKPKKGGYGKSGKGIKAQSIKYVPMPHHDLPILIYQSDINPPIHVVNPPKGHSFSSSYGVPSSKGSSFSSSSFSSGYTNSIPQAEYGTPKVVSSGISSTSYGVPQQQSSQVYGAPSVTSQSYGVPSVSSQSYDVPSVSSQSYGVPAVSSSHSFASSSSSYGPPKSSKGFRSLKGDFGGSSLKSYEAYGPPKKATPLPHIIYAGHPPIHIFQQPPIYMSAPTKSSYGSKSKKAQFSSYSKGSSYTEYGAPSKGSSVTYTEYGAPSKGSSYSSYSKGQYKGDNGGFSKGHKGESKGFGSHFGSAFGNHFGFGKSSFSFSLPKFNYGGSSHGHSKSHSSGHHQKTKYVVAPKAWNKPPIIIYQGVRPPVTVYETPATSGGYSDVSSNSGGYVSSAPVGGYASSANVGGYSSNANVGGYSSGSVVAPVQVAPVAQTHTVDPIALAPPVTLLGNGHQQQQHDPHAHVAGTDAPGNPNTHAVDLTYGVARISPDAGQLIDPRHKYTAATSRSIWIPTYGLPVQYQQARQQLQQQQQQPAALYVSDLTTPGGQNYQIIRRTDLDQSILYGISDALRTQEKNAASPSLESKVQQQQPMAQSRIDVLPNFLSTANENTLSSIPVSYSSVIIPSAGPGNASPSSSPASESMVKSGSKSS